MARLVAYRTNQATFQPAISRISDTFLIYQAERKRRGLHPALGSKPSTVGGQTWPAHNPTESRLLS